MTPEEALKQFQQVTGLRVFAVLDRDGTVWWANDEYETPTFECTIGDRVLHIDELAPCVTGSEAASGQHCPSDTETSSSDQEGGSTRA